MSRHRCCSSALSTSNRPLPDERPRQSVANLIGRFETQNKRASQVLSAGSPSRSSSVISHVTEDSVKEEIKEKREWPPKSVTEADKSPPSLSSRNIPPALVTQSSFGESNRWKKDAPTDETDVPLTAKALNASERQTKGGPNSFLENWRKDLPPAQVDVGSEPTPTASAPDEILKTPKPATTQKLGTAAIPRTSNATKAATSKPTLAASKSFTPASKTPVKSPASKQSLTPLKPQHTGQSVTSSATTRRAATKAPATASAKTPSRSEVATRAKTPTSSARPKTPSTGLFAPTAASLARSRNAPPLVPTPTKKTTISSSSMDRLSKPTAASKAKIASAPTSSPSRPAASSASLTAAKPKVATSPPKVKKSFSVPQAASGAAVSASIAVIGLAFAAAAEAADNKETVDDDVTDSADNVASSDTNIILPVDQPTESIEETPESTEEVSFQSEEHEVAEAVPEVQTQEETGEGAEAVAPEENGPTPISSSPAPEAEEATEASADPAAATEAPEPTPSENHEVKDDLEQMVNLLESVSITNPHEDTIVDIPDEILEIPDEDEK